jgi:hypothetical protein
MAKRKIRILAVTGITIVAAALATLSTTAASAATTTASAPGHVTAPRAAKAAADPSGCVTEDFSEVDKNSYEPCVRDEQVPASAAITGHQLKNVRSGKCVTNGGSTANSAPITQYTCNGSANQAWTYDSATLQFKNNSGKCLTDGGSTGNSAPITQSTCSGSQNQQWLLFLSGSYEGVQNVHDNSKCMTNGGSLANSAPITQYTCNGSQNQQWTG